jgi:hypothetical protein
MISSLVAMGMKGCPGKATKVIASGVAWLHAGDSESAPENSAMDKSQVEMRPSFGDGHREVTTLLLPSRPY